MAGRPDLKRGTLIALLAAVIVNGGAFASDGKELREGQRLYKAGKYNAAAGYFVGVMAREPKNANAIYYAAVSFQKAGDLERANNFYRLLIEHFPNSQAAVYARKAVGSSSAPARPTPTGRKQTSALRPGDSIPDRASVPFRREPGGHLYVDCQVNGRTLPMVFDTGAEACTIGKGQLSSLGLKVPEGARHIQVSGVGGVEDTVVVPTTIRLGNISRTVNVLCMEETKYSLLGQTFFGDLH
ncbi:MAG: aspartyl protease family protein [Cyanobacteria bacterium HKST-UBA02]|nr:aspartyl protease family protein [Cyanobacteria bacterium HKST-UBA02]